MSFEFCARSCQDEYDEVPLPGHCQVPAVRWVLPIHPSTLSLPCGRKTHCFASVVATLKIILIVVIIITIIIVSCY